MICYVIGVVVIFLSDERQNDGGPDLAAWKAAMSEYVDSSATWLTTPWLTAEFYFYRSAGTR